MVFIRGKSYKGFSQYVIYPNADIYSYYMNDLMKKTVNNDGYIIASLRGDDGKKHRFLLHRLIAQIFIPNPRCLPIVNHKDLDKKNNDVSNLEWVTQTENMTHAVKNGVQIGKLVKIYQFEKDGTFVKAYNSVKEAVKNTGISQTNISSALRGRSMYAGGFYWSKENKFVQPHNKLCKPVNQICIKTGDIIKTFLGGAQEAEKITGINGSKICAVCKGKRKTTGGYIWKYANIVPKETNDEWKTWKHIENYPEYRISKDGRVYSERRKCLLDFKPRGGYIKVTLMNEKMGKISTGIHRLVASAYIPNPHNYPVVNHLDGNKSNNRVENLEWTTYQGNARHAFDNGLVSKYRKAGHKLKTLKPNSRRVGKYDLDGVSLLQEYDSIACAARDIGVRPSNISGVCRGDKQKTAGGYKWKYLD